MHTKDAVNQEEMSHSGCFEHQPCSKSLMSDSKVVTNESSNSYDIYHYTNIFFATEKFNLPREKVVDVQSCRSSPSHGFKQSFSPNQMDRSLVDSDEMIY